MPKYTKKAAVTRKASGSAKSKVKTAEKNVKKSSGEVFVAHLANLKDKAKYEKKHSSNKKSLKKAKETYKNSKPKPRKLSRKK